MAGLGLLILALSAGGPSPSAAQVPEGRVHLSLTLGGYVLLGVGYTHWVEKHHALEFTVFPFAYPRDGFPFGVRAGYAWLPSDEVWRAKLGGNLTVVIRPAETNGDRLVPILALTPGVQYDPTNDRSLRVDLWMSYYMNQRVFAPTAVEILSGWRK